MVVSFLEIYFGIGEEVKSKWAAISSSPLAHGFSKKPACIIRFSCSFCRCPKSFAKVVKEDFNVY
jgi:hypothetical protein